MEQVQPEETDELEQTIPYLEALYDMLDEDEEAHIMVVVQQELLVIDEEQEV